MKIKTGNGTITVSALIAIWSVSALTSLPGLAVSPILGDLSKIFPDAAELDIQMLTSLPSLLIIPFILVAGHISERVGYIKLLGVGLSIFLISGILYFFCRTMHELILVSALLGMGAGIIIPLSTALVSRFFTGEYRTKQFGYTSAITNITLVVATALTGYLADVNWRLPFCVYLLPAVSLLMIPVISKADAICPITKRRIHTVDVNKNDYPYGEIDLKKLSAYMVYYFLITFLTVIISFNLPFLIERDDSSTLSGILISLFYLAIMLPGFFLNSILKLLGSKVKEICLILIGIGLCIIYLFHSPYLIAIGCIITGVGYGIAQPYIYDVTTSFASPRRTTFALALVMSMNYVAILVFPFLIDGFQSLLHDKSGNSAFGINLFICIISLICILLTRLKRIRNGK